MRELLETRKAEMLLELSEGQREYYKEVPIRYQRIYLESQVSRSFKNLVKIKCLDCMGWVKYEVTHCQAEEYCPMWKYRPYQVGNGDRSKTRKK